MTGSPQSPNEMSAQEKRLLLEKLLRERAAQKSSPPPEEEAAHDPAAHETPVEELSVIQPVDRAQEYFVLSSAQQRLWLVNQFDPGNPVFNISVLLRLKGPLNLPAFEESIAAIGRRHEILRANFTVRDGKPVQFFSPDRVFALTLIDLQDQPEFTRLSWAEGLLETDANHAFDLEHDALARANLVRLGEEDHIFQLIVHHIVFDGWSLNLFLHELTALYTAACRQAEPLLPALPVQYVDFANWESGQFQDELGQAQVEYWKQKLAGPLPVLELPLDRPRPEMQTFKAGYQTLEVAPPLVRQLNELTRQEGGTLFMTMLAVFYLLLARYTGQEDIIVGTPIARRSRAEIEKLLGVFLNNLSLRTDLSGNINFRELVRRVRRTAIDAFRNQDVPFERLLNELRIERDSSHSPVFQVFFNLIDLRKGLKLELPDLTVETPTLPEIGSLFDLTLYVQNWGDTLKLKLVYNADLFSAGRMQTFLERYHHFLEEVTANPDRPIFAIPLPGLARMKQAAIIANFERLENEYTPFLAADIQQSLPQRFEQQAERFAGYLAVKTPRFEWTYAELNRMANRSAHAILRHVDAADQRVALLFDHDAPMVAGLLGALKAGKTYIPLDPSYPEERLRYMLADSQAKIIVTNGGQIVMAQALAGSLGLPVLDLDALPEDARDDNPGVAIAPESLAYILYTSGSTGQPKGVMQIHRNVLHFMRAYSRNLHIGARDRLSLLSSYSFDAAIMDIFGALLNGAGLYPIDLRKEGLVDLPGYLRANRITIYHSTPTVYRYLLNAIRAGDSFPDFRLIVLGGEAVIRRDVELYRQHFPDECIFVNGLGPTESTVSLQYFIDKQTEISGNAVPVGFAVEETEVLLLDASGEPAGLSGEIAIRSPYIALGYWQKPEITQAAFMPELQPGGPRTYRTGDLGFLLPDGTLEFRGRKDFQVKIRGHRVEVGEVETRLMEHPQIQECAVNAVDDGSGGTRLAAYFVPHGDPPSAAELRQFLKVRLPEYMIPAVFMPLASLPLTPTRKIDRRALPEPDLESLRVEREPVAARGETEQKLVKLWQELLKVRAVGVRDNFFELGGHSLMAVLLFNQIQEEFGVNLPLATLFQNATIEHLAEVIDGSGAPQLWSSLVEIEGQGDRSPFFCVHGLTGDILWFRELAHCMAPDFPFYGLQARGLDSVQEPLSTIAEMAAHYIQEIRRCQPHGPYFLGGASFGGTVVLEIAQQLQALGETVSLLAVFDHAPANIARNEDSGKLQSRLNRAVRIAKNFPAWMINFLKLGPSMMLLRVRRKLRLAKKARGPITINNLDEFDANDLIDFAADLPEHRRQLILRNYYALKAYAPQAYNGPVVLFKAMSRPLMNTNDPERGWQILSPGQVKVIKIPGSHEGMFRAPQVQKLADYLKHAIDEAAASTDPAATP